MKIVRKRKCFQCKYNLTFDEFKRANTDLSDMVLKKIWTSDYVELYCCVCYESMKFKIRMLEREKTEEMKKMKPKEQLRYLYGNDADLAFELRIKPLDQF